MSRWAIVKTEIHNISKFEETCRNHDVAFSRMANSTQRLGREVYAELKSKNGGRAYVLQKGDAYCLSMDNDRSYSQFARDVGTNGGILNRDYVKDVILDGVVADGGMVNSIEEQKNGDIILRVSNL
jgi:hypothetical protein